MEKKFSWLKFFKGLSLCIGIVYGLISIFMYFSGYNSFPEMMGRKKGEIAEVKRDTAIKAKDDNVNIDTANLQKPPKEDTVKKIVKKPVKPRPKPKATEKEQGNDGFLITFFKTPVVLVVFYLAILGCLVVGIFDAIMNVFQNFSRGFPVFHNVADWAFGDVAGAWYAHHAIWWHIILSVIVWLLFMSVNDKN